MQFEALVGPSQDHACPVYNHTQRTTQNRNCFLCPYPLDRPIPLQARQKEFFGS